MIPNRPLSDHYNLYDLTATAHAGLEPMNRLVTNEQISKLGKVAMLLESVRQLLEIPLKVTSGYRCPALNKMVGSSERSQHLKCEAVDFVPIGEECIDVFKTLRHMAKDGKFQFGQLILENDDREGRKIWLHLSLGDPFRDRHCSGQILTMCDGAYTMLEAVPQGGLT